jgi:hypothetical protein
VGAVAPGVGPSRHASGRHVSLTLDPLTRVDSTRRELDASERAGVTHVAAGIVADSRDHYEG